MGKASDETEGDVRPGTTGYGQWVEVTCRGLMGRLVLITG